MKPIKIIARRDAYSIATAGKTMTAGELARYLLENFDENQPIYLVHDNGYTYGSIIEDRIYSEEELY